MLKVISEEKSSLERYLCGFLHLIGSVKSSVVQRSLLVVVPDVDVEGVRLEEAFDHLGRALQLALK